MRAFAPRASGGPPRTRLHELSYLRTGKLKSRRETRQNAGEDGDEDTEPQHWKIDTNSGFVRKGVFRQPAHQEREQTIGQQDAAQRAQQRQCQSLGKKLALDSPTASADRASNGKLMLAGGAAGQQKDGHVGTADQQEQRHRSKQQEQRRAEMFNIPIVVAPGMRAKFLGEMVGSFPGELFEQRP